MPIIKKKKCHKKRHNLEKKMEIYTVTKCASVIKTS